MIMSAIASSSLRISTASSRISNRGSRISSGQCIVSSTITSSSALTTPRYSRSRIATFARPTTFFCPSACSKMR